MHHNILWGCLIYKIPEAFIDHRRASGTDILHQGIPEGRSCHFLILMQNVQFFICQIGFAAIESRFLHRFDFLYRTPDLLRQPDVILIGEIRDAETAAIAVQSALTGHLVFSTLHTNDAPGAVTRLFDMGVEPFLLSSVLRGVVAQRLVRMLCPHCREAYLPDGQELEKLGAARSAYRPGQPLYRAKGCPDCLDTGYRGRMAIYEIMPVSDALKRLIVDKADANVLGACALSEAMRNLRHDGMLKVIAGLTSLTEVARVTNE